MRILSRGIRAWTREIAQKSIEICHEKLEEKIPARKGKMPLCPQATLLQATLPPKPLYPIPRSIVPIPKTNRTEEQLKPWVSLAIGGIQYISLRGTAGSSHEVLNYIWALWDSSKLHKPLPFSLLAVNLIFSSSATFLFSSSNSTGDLIYCVEGVPEFF